MSSAHGLVIDLDDWYHPELVRKKVLGDLYGLKGAPTRPYRISGGDLRREDPGSPLIKFPTSVLEWVGLKIPFKEFSFTRIGGLLGWEGLS